MIAGCAFSHSTTTIHEQAGRAMRVKQQAPRHHAYHHRGQFDRPPLAVDDSLPFAAVRCRDRLLPWAPFVRIAQELTTGFKIDIMFYESALIALQQGTEEYMLSYFALMQKLASNRARSVPDELLCLPR
jgi:histone H3/H4